ncbi:UPF0184 protein C9orf16 homolog [Puma concolor]|uniref:UPF0184 protein C9orf16 homolog n=1 Tax=Puma concolor TaxID=9696 RepID=A0A6P6H1X8_PUMCO|nr:UPF0184 protein C9orf16 homolog [Puma concolor]
MQASPPLKPVQGEGKGAKSASSSASSPDSHARRPGEGRGSELDCEAGCGRDARAESDGGQGRSSGGGAGWGRSSGRAVPALGAGRGCRAPFRRAVPLFRSRVPSGAATFRPAPALGATVAPFRRRAALAAPEPAMSGPNGDLGMPAEAGVEGEDDGFGEADAVTCWGRAELGMKPVCPCSL